MLGARRGGGATVPESTLRGKQIWRCVCRGQTRLALSQCNVAIYARCVESIEVSFAISAF